MGYILKMIKIYVEVYGCAASQDDAAIIRGLVNKASYKIIENINKADVIILVTCIVKSSTQSKVVSKIKEIIKKYPKKKLIIAGCMPEAEREICKEIAPNASLINSHHVRNIVKLIKNKDKILEFLGKRKENKLNLPKITKNKEVVNIQIAEGCKGNCSYCITKFAKGDLYSFSQKEIIKEIKTRLKQSYKRINLTATDCGCYGLDIKTNLPELLEEIVKIEGDFKIRVGMMNPEFTLKFLNQLIKIYKDKKIIKFLHIPIQSGSNKVLKDMQRKYNVNDFKKIIKAFRKEIPNLSVATDIIVGYPTETEKDFKETLNLLKEIKPEVLNVSKFSSIQKTKASKLKQLTSQVIKERSVKINQLFQ